MQPGANAVPDIDYYNEQRRIQEERSRAENQPEVEFLGIVRENSSSPEEEWIAKRRLALGRPHRSLQPRYGPLTELLKPTYSLDERDLIQRRVRKSMHFTNLTDFNARMMHTPCCTREFGSCAFYNAGQKCIKSEHCDKNGFQRMHICADCLTVLGMIAHHPKICPSCPCKKILSEWTDIN